ncbi:hypothetical protein HN51_007197, partial [Arachis hypogaea]
SKKLPLPAPLPPLIDAASLCNPNEVEGIMFDTQIVSPNPGAPNLCLLALVCH